MYEIFHEEGKFFIKTENKKNRSHKIFTPKPKKPGGGKCPRCHPLGTPITVRTSQKAGFIAL
jgi:hypothetical protein